MKSYEPSVAEWVPVMDEDLTGLTVEDELGRGAFTTVHLVRSSRH